MQIRTMKEEHIMHNEAIKNIEIEKKMLDSLIEQSDENIDNINRKIDESIKNIQEMRAK